jgi:hypothetical protein
MWRGISIAVVSVLLAGCGADDGADAPDDPTQPIADTAEAPGTTVPSPDLANGGLLTLATAACGFEPGAHPIPAGRVRFTVENQTEVLGVVNIARLEGASFQEFAAHVAEELRLAKAGEPGLGHPSYAVPIGDVLVDPGETVELTATLEPGTHALLCGRLYEEVGELRPSMAIGPVEVGSD